eukprot:359900-Chlamydomonas_euryale.AAC.9
MRRRRPQHWPIGAAAGALRRAQRRGGRRAADLSRPHGQRLRQARVWRCVHTRHLHRPHARLDGGADRCSAAALSARQRRGIRTPCKLRSPEHTAFPSHAL